MALLEQQAVTRVPELVPIRYGRMLVSAFTFYRGAALIMASDPAGTPRSGFTTQVLSDRIETTPGHHPRQTLDRLAEDRHEIATDTPRVVFYVTLDSRERPRIDALGTDR